MGSPRKLSLSPRKGASPRTGGTSPRQGGSSPAQVIKSESLKKEQEDEASKGNSPTLTA